MSDSSSLSDPLPSASFLEDALRSAVRHVYQDDNLENLTIKRVRRAVEEQLGLNEDYFKNNAVWKEKSKTIIQSEVEAHADPESSQISVRKNASPKLPQMKATPQTNGKKRPLTDKSSSRNQRRKEPVSDDESEKRKSPPITSLGVKATPPSPTAEAREGSDPEGLSRRISGESKGASVDGSESEMSEVLDEAPKPRRKRKSAGSERSIPKKRSKVSKAPQVEQPKDPDAEEIKRLQGWLVKCGIRKMWFRELQSYNTPKAKIRHLKDMLAEAGMTGRYSAEKASQIREERELKADLEAVQAGNKQWGTEEPQEDGNSRPKRRLAKGLKELDFLNDNDGEETD